MCKRLNNSRHHADESSTVEFKQENFTLSMAGVFGVAWPIFIRERKGNLCGWENYQCVSVAGGDLGAFINSS